MLEIKRLIVGELETNCYLIFNAQTKEALIIDPGSEFDTILKAVQDYQVKEILLTHSHFDHTGALFQLENFYHLKHNEGKSSFDYEIIPTPGHTKDSLSFYFPLLNAVFVGDFIFEGTIGRIDLGGNKIEMKNSIRLFLDRFQEDIQIYPGHGERTTLKNEKESLTKLLKSW